MITNVVSEGMKTALKYTNSKFENRLQHDNLRRRQAKSYSSVTS